MQLVVTDRVAWSVVIQSVCLSQLWSLQKWLNWSRCHFWCGLGWAQERCVMIGCILAPGLLANMI